MEENQKETFIPSSVVREMTGATIESMIEIDGEMSGANLITARMVTIKHMLRYIASGAYLTEYMQINSIDRNKLNSSWRKQFNYIVNNAPLKYSKNAKYFTAAAQYIPVREDVLQSGDPSALAQLNLISLCADLMSALHPNADHAFFKAAIDDMPEYIKKRGYPHFTQAPELTEEEQRQIKEICEETMKIYKEDETQAPDSVIEKYLALQYSDGKDIPVFQSISTVRDSGKIRMSISKASRKQHIIALSPDTMEIEVGGTGKWSATIKARIGDSETEYTPDPTHRHIQDAIAQIGEENGWPITVTPAQIYRTFAGLDRDAVVWPAQEAEIEEAIDTMLATPAEIDFTEQAEKHPNSHKDKDFDYSNAKLNANLITGEKGAFIKNGRRTVAYTIYTQPVFYKYSKAVGQIKTIDRKLISGTTTPKRRLSLDDNEKIKPQPKSQRENIAAEGGTRNTVMRRYLADRITDMQKTADKKSVTAAENRRIAFSTIAEESGTTITPRSIRTIRENTSRILNEFIQLKQIKGFTVYKKGRALQGVEIDL